MTVRPVITIPALVLSAPALEVDCFDACLASLIKDLCETMVDAPGCVGLAAVQIGVSQRVFVVDVAAHPKTKFTHGLIVAVNPVITAQADPKLVREGCMSVPDFTGALRRADKITMGAQDRYGEPFEISTSGFEAQAILHELDHLEGKVFLDRVTSVGDVYPRKRYM